MGGGELVVLHHRTQLVATFGYKEKDIKMRILLAVLATALASGTMPGLQVPLSAQSSSGEIAKDGSCPTGFKASGSTCKSANHVAIKRLGSCPTGFKASGNYCVGDKSDYAEIRSGSCASGLKVSGKYCVKS